MTGKTRTRGQGGRDVHVGLLYHSFQSENLGVGAFTVANVALIGEAVERHGGSPVFHVIGARGGKDYSHVSRWPADFTNIGLKALANPRSDLAQVIGQCDVFFDIAGGDSFTDIYGPGRFTRLLGARALAAITGKPMIMSPQTIGPFTSWWGRVGARAALRRCEAIFARDALSYDALGEFGVQDRSELTSDLAFQLPYDRPPEKNPEALAGGGWEVGVNVSGLLFRDGGNRDGRLALALDYARFTRKTIEKLLADDRIARVHLVPHVLAPDNPDDNDGAASERLKREYPELVVAPDFASPSAAKSYIATLDLLLGARMHATIAAVSSDTAVLPLAYSRKFNGLYGSLDYPYLADMVNTGKAQCLAELDRILDELPEAARAAARANAKARDQLSVYTDFLDRFFARELAD